MLNSILSHFIVALFLQYLSILTVTCYYCIPSNHGGNSRAPGWSTSFRRHYWLGPCHKRLAWNCCCPRISCFGCMLIANSCVEPIRCHRVTIVSVTQYVTISWRSQRMGTIATGARWMNHDNFTDGPWASCYFFHLKICCVDTLLSTLHRKQRNWQKLARDTEHHVTTPVCWRISPFQPGFF